MTQVTSTAVKSGPLVDFVILANLGRSDGGQETWAYQFIPALLARHPALRMRIYGQRLIGKPDTTPELINAVGAAAPRLKVRFFPARRTRWPLLFSMLQQFVLWKTQETEPRPMVTIAVGSVIELLFILASRRSRGGFNIVWLRSIWFDQKAHRVPRQARWIMRRLEVWLLARADLLLANGDDIADYYGSKGLKVAVIKNAIDTQAWRLPPPRFGTPIAVAYVGRLAPEKGINAFLDIARMVRSGPDRNRFVFHVLGGGGYDLLAEAAVARGDIVWHGLVPHDELRAKLSQMDVCVAFTFASSERGGGGTSNAMMEQLAAGRLLLAWDNVIFRQWLDQDTAFLVPQGDVPAAVAALAAIATDPAVARARAAAGQAVVADFDVPTMMRRFDQEMAQVLADWPTPIDCDPCARSLDSVPNTPRRQSAG